MALARTSQELRECGIKGEKREKQMFQPVRLIGKNYRNSTGRTYKLREL